MEDWYHALLQASLQPDSSMSTKLSDGASSDIIPDVFSKVDGPIGSTFSQHDMASLLVSLDSLPDPLPLRWLNALVGRIFFSVYRTAWLENYIISKMMKKINRVKTPGFLGDIKVVEVDVGRRAPGFSRPMLKALTSEGEASMEIAVHYVGEVRITISTTLNSLPRISLQALHNSHRLGCRAQIARRQPVASRKASTEQPSLVRLYNHAQDGDRHRAGRQRKEGPVGHGHSSHRGQLKSF